MHRFLRCTSLTQKRVASLPRFPIYRFSTVSKSYEMILVERKGKVGVITLNRPKALNALCSPLMKDLSDALSNFQNDPEIGAIIITGSTKAFAAGADIKEMSNWKYPENYIKGSFSEWDAITSIKKPIIAAVNGYALGGGCELAMMCDIIIAGENAQFGQPEITLGTIPGVGGTQRLIRAVGKSKAMEMILTGKKMSAKEAENAKLVCRVVPEGELLDSALKTANEIASFSQPIVAMAKEAINKSFELTLREGLVHERNLFFSTFATKDQKEGMNAFVNKSKPNWADS